MARKKLSKIIPSNAVGGQGNSALAILIGGTVGIAGGSGTVMAGPTGGQITNGQGSISTPSDVATVIDQSSHSLSIDWRSFDIAANESVRFNQPTTNSVAVNRILDQKPSEIFGRLDSNGRVVLVNSNGVLFGAGSQVNVGSLAATSLNVVSFDETTGRLSLSAAGTPGAIVNDGTITAGPNGSVSLVGGSVANNGLIVAEYGSVNLAAGRAATIDFYGGGLLRFDADSSLTQNATGAIAGVSNAGQIEANGGQVLLTTSAARNVFDRAINNDGVIRANRIDNSGGAIRLMGAEGTVVSSGVLDASGVGTASTGGTVHVLGENVGLFGNALLDVSGDAGGGVALIGGDYQGANASILNSQHTIVQSGAHIDADANVAGNGGRVIVWSDGITQYYGDLSARGGATSGNGGFAEVSGHGVLEFGGGANLGASHGARGALLLDPRDINIETTGPNNANSDFGDAPNTSTVGVDDILAVLDTGDLLMRATDDIHINAAIDASAAQFQDGDIEMRAGDNIEVHANITTNSGNVTLLANNAGGTPNTPVGTGDVIIDSGVIIDTNGGNVTFSSEGNLVLGAIANAANVTLTSTNGSVTQHAGVTLAGTTLVVTGTSINLDTAVDNINGATATTGAITISEVDAVTVDNVVATGAGGAVSITAAGNLTLADGAINAGGNNVTLGAGVGGAITDGAVTSVTGNELSITSAGSLDVHTAIVRLNAVLVGAGLTVNDASGDLTIVNANAGGAVTLNAGGGSLIDDDSGTAATTTISGSSITLTAAQNIGNIAAIPTIADLRNGLGSSMDVDTNGALIARSSANNGQINLNLIDTDIVPDPANLGADAIRLGGTTNAAVSGMILLQSAGDLNTSAFNQAAITLHQPSPNAAIAFRSGGVLTLAATNGATRSDESPGTFVLNGATSIVDSDLGNIDISLAGTSTLYFDTANGSAVLDTSITNLHANVGGSLEVNENTNINLVNVQAAGTIDVSTASNTNGDITVGNVTSTGGNVILNAVDDIIDDGDGSGVTRITANTITLTSGENTGAAGTAAEAIDTEAVNLNLTATNGNIVVTDATEVNISGFTSNGASTTLTQIETTNGTITLSSGVDIRPSRGDVSIVAGNADLDFSLTGGHSIGRQTTGTGDVRIQAGDDLRTGQVFGDGVNLQAGLNSTTGDLFVDQVTANSGTATVVMEADGSITDAAGVTPSVVADILSISSAGSVDLETNVITISANNVAGNFTAHEHNGGLAISNGDIDGAVEVTTDAGNLSVTGTTGTGAILTAGGTGSLSLGIVTLSGDATLTAGGAISDGAGTATSITADDLTINGATTVILDTSVNTVTSTNANQGVTIREANGLTVANVTATGGAVDILTNAGNLNVTNASGSTAVSLAAGGSGALNITAASTGGTATLSAGGAINDAAAGGTAAVTANVLTITDATTVSLETDVNTLNASGIDSTFTIHEMLGALDVNNATSTSGLVTVTTATGPLNVDSATGNGVTLTATGGNLTLTNVNAGASGTATLASTGSITHFAPGSVSGGTLAITGATLVDLDTNVGTLNATGVTGNLSIDDHNANLTVVSANSTGGITTLQSVGSILDDDPGTGQGTNISGTEVHLTATNGIGSVTDFTTGAGSSVDVTTNGPLTVNVTSNSGAINLNIAGIPTVLAGGITLGSGTGRSGTVVLQSGAALNLQNLNDGAISIGNNNTASVGYVSGGVLTLRDTGSVTDFAPLNLLVSGADVVSAGLTPRTVALTAGTLNFNASAAAGDFQLNTDVNVLNADVGNVALNVDQIANAGDITLGRIVSQALDVNTVVANGAILDDGNDTTVLTGANISLSAGGAIGSNATLADAIDVDTPVLFAASYGAGGDVVINSVRTGSTVVTAGAGVADLTGASGNGNLILRAQGDISTRILQAEGDTVTVTTTGQLLTDVAPSVGMVVNANQLIVTTASAVNLVGTNINTLNATVAGPLSLSESTGALTVANAVATGAINVSTVDGALNVTNANSSGGALTLAAGGTGTLTIGTATALGAINASTVNGTLNATTVISNGGVVTLTAGGANALTFNAVTGTGASLTSGAALTLGSVNVSGGTASLTAAGAITDGAAATASVTANQLTITAASSADLDTDVNILDASVTGALSVREVSGALSVTNAAGSSVSLTAGGVGGALAIGTVNAGAGGTATLSTVGTITDGAAATASVTANQLTITAASSADLDTNVNILNASVTGALSVREVSGALSVTNAAGSSVSLTAGGVGGALTLGTVNAGAGTGTATLAATGAITDGVEPQSVTANQLTITGAGSADLDTNINTLNANGVTGALTVRERTGALTVANATAAGAINLSTTAGDLTVTNAASTGGAITLAAGGTNSALTLGTVHAGTNAATLTATGAITDGATGATSLTAGAATLTGASIGSTGNTLNTSVISLTATSTTGGMFFREANDIALTSLAAAANQDIVVGAEGDITVSQIAVTGSNGAGRVLLAAGSDIFTTGSGDHITAQNVELRSGGLDAAGGRIGVGTAAALRMIVPDVVPGSGNSGSVPSVLVLQNPGANGTAAQEASIGVSGNFVISSAVFPVQQAADNYLTTTFSTRTAQNVGGVAGVGVVNVPLGVDTDADIGFPSFNQGLSEGSDASNVQGEGTLYIDWASFDPNVSLFGTVNPPICLPRDQQDDDSGDSTEGAPNSGAGSGGGSGCASTTAQYDNRSLGLPELRLVITSHGPEWVRVRVPVRQGAGPLRIAQSR